MAETGGVPLPYQEPLKALAKLTPEEFQNVLASLSEKKLATSAVLAKGLAEAVPTLSAEAKDLVGACVSLMSRADSQPDRVTPIARTVSNAAALEIPPADQPEFAKRLTATLCSPAIRFTAKALTLSADQENLYVDCHIVTDIRPVFPDDTTSMAAAVITDHLRISYYDRKSDLSTIYVALDQGDLLELREQIDRALAKNQSMRRFLEVADVDHFTEENDHGSSN